MSLLTPPTTPRNSLIFSGNFDYNSNSKSFDQLHYQQHLPFTPPDSPTSSIKFIDSTPSRSPAKTQSRQLSDNELSYYLPSRHDGVNDMYVSPPPPLTFPLMEGIETPANLSKVPTSQSVRLVRCDNSFKGVTYLGITPPLTPAIII